MILSFQPYESCKCVAQEISCLWSQRSSESLPGDSVPSYPFHRCLLLLYSQSSSNLRWEPQRSTLGRTAGGGAGRFLSRKNASDPVSCESILLLGVRLKRIDYGRRRKRHGESLLNRNTCGGSSSRPWRSKDLANLNRSLKSLGQSQFTEKSPVVTLEPSVPPPVSNLIQHPRCICCLVLGFFISL